MFVLSTARDSHILTIYAKIKQKSLLSSSSQSNSRETNTEFLFNVVSASGAQRRARLNREEPSEQRLMELARQEHSGKAHPL